MERQSKKYMGRRILMAIAGTVLSGLSVGIFKNSSFGVDPFQCLCNGITTGISMNYGTLYIFINAVFLVLMFFLAGKSIGIYTFFNMFFLGYIIDFFTTGISTLFPNPTLFLRIIFLIVGLSVLSLAAAFIFTADLGISTYDWVAPFISDKCKRLPFKYSRIITDLICCGAGFALGCVPGIATVITALCMGPEISFCRKHITDPIIPE